MKKNKQPFEKNEHDLTGHASVDFLGREDFSAFASKLTGYNPDRFAPVALRMFIQKGEPILTLYALDMNKEKTDGKLPVKKFKMKMELTEMLKMMKRFDFTVSDGKYDISDIVVTNK
jgi:hypothetical protein